MASCTKLKTILLILFLSPLCWAGLIPTYKPAAEDTAKFRLNLRGPFVNGTHSYSNSTSLRSNTALLALNSSSISNSSLHGVSSALPVVGLTSISNSSSIKSNTTAATIDFTDDVDEVDESFDGEEEGVLLDELEEDEEEVDSNSTSLESCIALPYTNSTSISKRSLTPCNDQPSIGSTKTASRNKKKGNNKKKPPKPPPLTCDPDYFDFSSPTNRNNASDYIDFFSDFSLDRQKQLFKLKGNYHDFTIPQQGEIDNYENELKLFGMENWGTTSDKNHFDCDLENGCVNVPTCDEIFKYVRKEVLNAPPEEGIVYTEEAMREHARRIWFAVNSIIGMNEQLQFKHRTLTRALNLTTNFLTFPGTQKPWEYANWASTNAEFEAQPEAKKLLPRLFLDRAWYRWTYTRWTGIGQEARFKGSDYCPKCLCWSILEVNKAIQSVLPDLTMENYMPHATTALNISEQERHVKFRDSFLAQQKDISKKEDSLLINNQENWIYISSNSHYKMDRLNDDKICEKTFFWNEFKEDPSWNGDDSGMNIGLMPWRNILGIVPHHRKLLLHAASRPLKESQFLVPMLVREKIVLVERIWERLRRGYGVEDEGFGTGADGGEGLKSSVAEWMREGLVWEPVEYGTMERAVRGASCKLSMDIMSTFYEAFKADDADSKVHSTNLVKPEDEAKWWSVCERGDFEAFGSPLVGEIPKDDITKGLW